MKKDLILQVSLLSDTELLMQFSLTFMKSS